MKSPDKFKCHVKARELTQTVDDCRAEIAALKRKLQEPQGKADEQASLGVQCKGAEANLRTAGDKVQQKLAKVNEAIGANRARVPRGSSV